MPTFSRYEQGKIAPVLAIGDSWFWYPNNNLVDAVMALPELKSVFRTVNVIGQSGAHISEFRTGKFRRIWRFEMDNFASSIVMISGGGNDAVSFDFALRSPCTDITVAKDCFDPVKLSQFIAGYRLTVEGLINDVQIAAQKQTLRAPAILINGYDFPVPDGTPFGPFGPKLPIGGPWLKPILDRVGVNPDLAFRTAVMAHYIREVNSSLTALAQQHAGVHCIANLGLLSTNPANYKDDWANELHPTRDGFTKLARGPWLSKLRTLGFAN